MAAARPLWDSVPRAIGRFIVTVALIGWTILDALLFPVLRPLIDGLARLRLFEMIGVALGRLPPYVALGALAVPFIIIEPFKVFALYWFGMGHFIEGTILLGLAHGGSILVVERVYHAMHAPLMRIGWFRRLMAWLDRLRQAALDWARSTELWQSAARLARGARGTVRHWLRALRRG